MDQHIFILCSMDYCDADYGRVEDIHLKIKTARIETQGKLMCIFTQFDGAHDFVCERRFICSNISLHFFLRFKRGGIYFRRLKISFVSMCSVECICTKVCAKYAIIYGRTINETPSIQSSRF